MIELHGIPDRPPEGRRAGRPPRHPGRVRSLPRCESAWRTAVLSLAWLISAGQVAADDWPQWMGPQRDGVWRETGVLERFETNGPPVQWRAPVKAGYVGPAVAAGRLFLLDREAGKPPERKRGDRTLPTIPGNERVLCLDAATGRTLWEHTYDCAYAIDYPAGPRATPVVRDGRVYTLGAMGDLRAFEVADGRLVWSRSLTKDFATEPPVWGYAAHPLLDGDRLIVPVGGTNSALVALDRRTGAEVWRALQAREIGYAPPVIRDVAGRRQLIFWHPDAVSGLNPETGEVLWTHPYPVGGKPQRPEVTIAMPRVAGDRLFLTSFYQGSLMLGVPKAGAEPRVLWNRRSSKQSEVTEGLATVMSTPVIQGECIYGICAFGGPRREHPGPGRALVSSGLCRPPRVGPQWTGTAMPRPAQTVLSESPPTCAKRSVSVRAAIHPQRGEPP